MKRLLILGTGTFAMDVADLVDDIEGLIVDGFVASIPPYEPGSTMLGRPIYWVDELARFSASHHAVCALVTSLRYRFIEQAAVLGMPFTSVIHPSARVSGKATVADGCIINAGVVVAAYTTLAAHVVLNRSASVGHHNTLYEYVTVSPGATLAGNITVHRRAYVGLGANVLQEITIGEQAIVGAGALVTKNVPARSKVMGLPARVVEENVDGL